MNVFELREKLIADYSSFISGFINIKDEEIKKLVEAELKDGFLWPDPLIQLNPFFEKGETLDELIKANILNPLCQKIFRIKKHESDLGEKQIQLYRHQSEAIKRAHAGENYVLTTGTGSGKSLAYIVPIVNHIVDNSSGRGIQAIIVYPMNALANSQELELTKFINYGFSPHSRPVTFKRYTGQESEQEKNDIITNPPDILLTNYVMLEYILTRPGEAKLVQACGDMRFLVLDELHTYRGRQGADVAMLIRRTKEATHAEKVICVGTSATLSSAGDVNEQNIEIARIASLLFGSEVLPENVIGEYLQRVTTEYDFQNKEIITALKQAVMNIESTNSLTYDEIKTNVLSAWIESTFGLTTNPINNKLMRSLPKSISGPDSGAASLAKLTGIETGLCTHAIQKMLLLGYQVLNPSNDFPVFAFRLHQFISRGDTVYASPEDKGIRHLTVQKQIYVPNSDKGRILLPLAFCRHCGQEFYTVSKIFDDEKDKHKFIPREVNERFVEQNEEPGFLCDADSLSENLDNVPEEWKDSNGVLQKSRKKDIPLQVYIDSEGYISQTGRLMLFLKAPFRYCPSCGVSYAANQHSDFAKLSALGTEGRSTATTILSLSAVRHIKQMDLVKEAQKLLSFTDNRQDASLQAGHFNDFVQVGLLRGALYHALIAKPEQEVSHEELTQAVFKSLHLDFKEYTSNPEIKEGTKAEESTNRALRDVLGYLLFRDLKRGWRITAPNLEQTGLLEIVYTDIDNLAADIGQWSSCHLALASASIETRHNILKVLLDWMRRELAIKVSYLNPLDQERIVEQSQQLLIPPWGFDENVTVKLLTHASVLYPRSRKKDLDYGGNVFLSPHSGFARYLKLATTMPDYRQNLSTDDIQLIINNLLEGLCVYGIIEKVKDPRDENEVAGYQIVANSIIWKAANGIKGAYDPIRQTSESSEGQPINEYFKEYYRLVAASTQGLYAKEHTAQVSYEVREQREQDFRDGTLPILYCSPTMELGIDISLLNVVNMRNIPPTPANYAQRSGRAGRSGQPALIFSYCSSGSPHDQYFFKRPIRMVSGSVATPQIDLANEELLHAHVNAMWLTESRMSLGKTLCDVLDVSGDNPSLRLLQSIEQTLNDLNVRQKALSRAARVIDSIGHLLSSSNWYNSDWLNSIMNQLPAQFEQACDRWRDLYSAARRQRDIQHKIIGDASRPPADKRLAERLRRDAESQITLLTSSTGSIQSDFYSYRYFASEGFLPGYNFPRLPLSAFIPGRKIKSGRDEYLSRPRFLAITEFGPRSFVYHEGSRYIINQVIMPALDDTSGIATSEIKLCPQCGYLHTDTQVNNCDNCNAELDTKISDLFRLQNVVAKRRDQINCDEEERLRLGFDVKTTLRFSSRMGNQSSIKTTLMYDNKPLATLTYGDSAMIWRINTGYRKRNEGEPEGFLLDVERGYWARRNDEEGDDDSPLGKTTMRVRPYVSDTKNCLLFELKVPADDIIMASLQSALKNAIQHVFELEDNELAAEPLPSKTIRKSILFYEAAEGGAGVLKRILDLKDYRQVMKEAIELCHYDPNTFEDLHRSAQSKEDCEAGCYDCLLSYRNQSDHELLDRKAVIEILKKLYQAEISRSSSNLNRKEHYDKLILLTDSDLERQWLDYIYNNQHILPTHAQYLIEDCNTKPDFIYKDSNVAIYIDGPMHDSSNIKNDDDDINKRLLNSGWYVLRFRYDNVKDWPLIIGKNSNIFGEKQ